MATDPLTGDRSIPSGLTAKLSAGIRAALSRRPYPTESCCDEDGQEETGADDVSLQQAWSISARLAAVPMSYLDRVPTDIASLIRHAKDLHPQVAQGAADNETRGERKPPL